LITEISESEKVNEVTVISFIQKNNGQNENSKPRISVIRGISLELSVEISNIQKLHREFQEFSWKFLGASFTDQSGSLKKMKSFISTPQNYQFSDGVSSFDCHILLFGGSFEEDSLGVCLIPVKTHCLLF
jgi:hypothetical protein